VRLAWIEARDFRNHRETALEVPPGLIAVVGPNGQGKTNLLEAMQYLCALASPRVKSDLPLVRIGASSAFVRGEVVTQTGRFLIEVEVRPSGANRVQVNRSAVRRKRDLRASVRSVFSGPDDLAIVQGEPDERRRFLDEAVRTLWPPREPAIASYERVLRQRNRLLKDWESRWEGTPEPAGLLAWDAELVTNGSILTALRADAVRRLAPRAGAEFGTLVGDPSQALATAYEPSVPGAADLGIDDVEAVFRDRLADRRQDELLRRTTLVGPHRDDLALAVHAISARGFASHGEAWGAALSLRLALAGAATQEVGEPPVLFLDDPFSPFDPERRERLAATLEGRGQVLIAVPDDAQVPAGAAVWRVKEGTVLPE
jgi:DNA replication and repair protein RecF